MKITEFGKAVRKARIDANVSLLEMAEDLKVTSPYLSGLETGRKKVTNEWVNKIYRYFDNKGLVLQNLAEKADISNEMINLEGIDPSHQAIIAGFARVTDEAIILQVKKLLEAANPKK